MGRLALDLLELGRRIWRTLSDDFEKGRLENYSEFYGRTFGNPCPVPFGTYNRAHDDHATVVQV
ncbi:MAG: hypothetical protein ACI9OJ_003227, partial [Myxococcota bacterium]